MTDERTRRLPDVPGRDDIENIWRAMIEGSLTREEVHSWTEPLIFGEEITDRCVNLGIRVLYGFDLSADPESPGDCHHGPPGEYLFTIEQIEQQLFLWKEQCEQDSDEVGAP